MNRIWVYACFILIGTFISSISQVMLKKAALKTYDSKITEYLNPLVISAYLIFFIATFLSILAYKEVPLSMGGVLESTSYFYVTIFGVLIFKERINCRKVIGLFIVIMGISVYSVFG